MTSRKRFVLLGWVGLVALVGGAVFWFTVVRDRQKPSPQPAPPKSTSELLVGKWKLVKHNVRQLPPGFEWTIEFTKEGEFLQYVNNPLDDPRVVIGVYRLEGNIIKRDDLPDLRIESITDDKLVTSAQIGSDLQIYEEERVREQ